MKKILYTRPDGGVSVVHPAPKARRKVLVSEAVYEDVYEDRPTGLFDPNTNKPVTKRVLVGRREVAPAVYRDETDEEFLARVMAKAVPADATDVEIVDETEIPKDRTHRDAWRKVGGRIQVDMDKARAIDAERMERARRARVRALMEREALGEDVTAEKAALRAVKPAEVVADAKTPDELKARWPADLART